MTKQAYINTKSLVAEFGSSRTQRCIDLMRPEVRSLVDLPLEKKIKKSKEIIKETFKKYKNVGVGFSGGGDSEVLLHMALELNPNVPVLFVDTRYEFPETVPFVEKIRSEWNVASLTILRAITDIAGKLIKKYGEGTPEFTLRFNDHHKIQPLVNGIINLHLDAFIAGIRGVEHEERAMEAIFSPREKPQHIRVHPMLFWTRFDVQEYLAKNGLPHNPLYDKGYTSLGSTFDTTPNKDPNMHERAGRGVARERIMKKLRALGYT